MSKYFTIVLLLMSGLLIAQNPEEPVSIIRKQYADVESRLEYCLVIEEMDWVDEEDYEGGVPLINGFFDPKKDNYIKITEELAGDWMERITSYYLIDGKVFFVFVKGYYAQDMFTAEELSTTEERLWERGGEAKTLLAHESRLYISDDKVILHLEKEVVLDASLNNFDLGKVENTEKTEDDFSIEFMRKHLGKAIAELEKRRTNSR